MSLLDKINSPSDIKNLEISQLKILAGEIRQKIVKTVSKNGGHLASSLGSVELIIALHYVFNAPYDKIIFDVGHQSYAHKLLTGRRKEFHTIRQYNGLSGFTRMSESSYDAFTTGHSSTSISAGLGMACGKALNNDFSKVIAVIGDGSMTAGIAYEGLNQAGDLRKDKNLIVILNDNDMSISPNVGAISSFLSRTFSAKHLQGFRKEFGEFLRSLPKIGDDIYRLAKRSEESFKAFMTPGMLFEAFNFDYFGPINGHKLNHLIDIFENIKELNEPVLLHVTTKKGKGYEPAEKNPVYFHGVGCFEIESGECIKDDKTLPTYTKIFGDTITMLAQKDDKIVAVTAAMPEGTGLAGFAKEHPSRFFDVGIAEQHGVTFAAGLATEGFKPVVAIYSTFLQRAYDQILHDICIENLPVVFAIDRGGIVGEDGATHHGLFDLSYLRAIPNMVVMAPSNENELRKMLVTALSHNGPIAFRYPRGSGVGVEIEKDIRPVEIGKGKIITKGDDLLIIAIGHSVNEALIAAKELEKQKISATVVDSRFVKPLDIELISGLVKKIPKVITVEENVRMGGFGSAVLEGLNDAGIKDFDLMRLGVKDMFIEHGPQKLLRSKAKIDSDAIIDTARQFILKTKEPCEPLLKVGS